MFLVVKKTQVYFLKINVGKNTYKQSLDPYHSGTFAFKTKMLQKMAF